MAIGSVLLADDEETFRESTSRLLQREGFACRCVQDTDEAIETLRHERYDVLVSDIRMSHNSDLRIVEEARHLDSLLPIILVTGYPSAESAIRAVGLAVEGYLTKPLDMDELSALLYKAVERSRDRRRLSSVIERLSSVTADLKADHARPSFHNEPGDDAPLATVRMLASCLSDLLVLWHKPATAHGLSNLCDLLDCPQRAVHRQVIRQAIEVLEKTKESFKSKQLAELRIKLQQTLGIKQGPDK